MNSSPDRNSSTRTGPYLLNRSIAAASCSSFSQIDAAVMPIDEPSAAGLAKRGKRNPSAGRPGFSPASCAAGVKPGLPTTRHGAVAIPCALASNFASGLSRVMAMVSGSEAVNGMPSICSMAGTCDSRPRPPTPSAKLNTPSTFSRSRISSISSPHPRRSVVWPRARRAPSSASTVSSESNSSN